MSPTLSSSFFISVKPYDLFTLAEPISPCETPSISSAVPSTHETYPEQSRSIFVFSSPMPFGFPPKL